MADTEGVKEAVQVSLKMMEMLQGLFGFTFNKTEKYAAFLGRGIGKGIRLGLHSYKTGKMLKGGEKTFQEIAQNRGSLDMAISTVQIEDWDSKEGLDFRKYLDNRGVQYVLLDDLTKGDNEVQFMFHASDADRVNSLLAAYKKIKFSDAKSMADAYDDLPDEEKQAVNATFEREVTDLDYRGLGIPENQVWNRTGQMGSEKTGQMDPEKKSEFSRPAHVEKEIYREVVIPEVNVKKDFARDIAFIRCGTNGYVVPLNCIQEEISGNSQGNMEVKIRCRISEQGMYLKFQNGTCHNVTGKDLAADLEQIKTTLWKMKNGFRGRGAMGKELPPISPNEHKKK